MHPHAISRLARFRGRGRRIADRPALEIVRCRQACGEGLVDPVDDRAARAEIPPKSLGFKCDATDALALGLEEERDVRLAERIDGLHRIAHAEKAPAICGLPASYEQLEQSRLGRGGVLVFVDQQVTDPVVERQRELSRCRIEAERIACSGSDCRMIEAVAFGEERQQFCDRMRQHRGECMDALPLRVGERRGRQQSEPREHGREVVMRRERIKHGLHFALEWRPGRTLACSQKALRRVDFLADGRIFSRRQKEICERAPGRRRFRCRRRQAVQCSERNRRALRRTGRRCRAAGREQRLPVDPRHGVRH